MPRVGWETVGAAIVVAASLALGAWPLRTPAIDTEISVERAIEDVGFIARDPHPMGTPEIGRVRDYLVATLGEMGLAPETQTVTAPDFFGAPGQTVPVTNVMARIAGTEDDDALLLMAHYDTVPSTPGANDNAAAVAALLETGRALVGQPPPHDVILLFTDGEEPNPRYGATAFTDHPWFGDVKLAANFEAIGDAGPSLLVETTGPAPALAGRLAAATTQPAMFSFLTKTADLIGGNTSDLDVMRATGIPGYNFAFMGDSSIYHTEGDAVSALHVAGMAHHAELAISIARRFGSLDLAPDESDAVFFTIPAGLVVRYGAGTAAAGGIAAVVVLGWVLADRIRRRRTTAVGLLAGTAVALGGALAAALAVTFVWMAIVAVRGDMRRVEGYVWLVVLVAGALGLFELVRHWLRRTRADLAGGALVTWGLLALLTGIWLPAMSYLFVWPALAAGLVTAAAPLIRTPAARLVALGVVMVPTAIVMTPAVDTLFQFAFPRPGNPGSQMPATIAVPLLLAVLAVALLRTATERTGAGSKP